MDRKHTKRFFKTMRAIANSTSIEAIALMVAVLQWWDGEALGADYVEHIRNSVTAYRKRNAHGEDAQLTVQEQAFVNKVYKYEPDPRKAGSKWGDVDELADDFAGKLLSQPHLGEDLAQHLTGLLGQWAYATAYEHRIFQHFKRGNLFDDSMPPLYVLTDEDRTEWEHAHGEREIGPFPVSTADEWLDMLTWGTLVIHVRAAAAQQGEQLPAVQDVPDTGEQLGRWVLECWAKGMSTERWALRNYVRERRALLEDEVRRNFKHTVYRQGHSTH